MKKVNALLLTPVVIAAVGAASIILAVGFIFFLALNPLVILGIVGIAAVVILAMVLFTTIFIALMLFATVYYLLKDVGEPFQRSESKKYSLKQMDEVGKKSKQ